MQSGTTWSGGRLEELLAAAGGEVPPILKTGLQDPELRVSGKDQSIRIKNIKTIMTVIQKNSHKIKTQLKVNISKLIVIPFSFIFTHVSTDNNSAVFMIHQFFLIIY